MLLYFDCGDRFQITGDGMVYVDEDKKTISKEKETRRSSECYGSVIISSTDKCICKWDLTLKIPERLRHTVIKIGIASTQLTNDESRLLGDKFYINSNVGWCKTHLGTIQCRSRYQNDDKMTITLDLKSKKVLFYNHRLDKEVCLEMTDVEGYDYRLAVQIGTPEISVCIDNFSQVYG